MKKKWSQVPHETWQIDGKSQVELATGEQVSWMNIGDEGSGAHLNAYVASCRNVEQMDPKLATRKINKSFARWGLPIRIKIDNGRPFVNTNGRTVPTKTILWWVGLGIQVIQNKPRCPQQNGIVECLQGTMKSWCNPIGQPNRAALQKRLNEESDFQRNHYRIPARKHKTRIELYPCLEKNERKYDPKKFNMQLVYDYLELKVFTRPILKKGMIRFFGEAIYVGRKYIGILATITFDPIEKQWLFRDPNGNLLKTSTKGVPCEKQIKAFAWRGK